MDFWSRGLFKRNFEIKFSEEKIWGKEFLIKKYQIFILPKAVSKEITLLIMTQLFCKNNTDLSIREMI